MNRRAFLQAAGALAARMALRGLAAPVALRAQARAGTIYAYTGCYTTAKRNGKGDGIHVFRMDAATGAWTPVQTLGGLMNPSFLITSRDGRFLYSVHGDGDYATAYSIDPADGRIAVLNKGATGGDNGVAHAFSRNGRFLVVANYGTGSVAVLPVSPDGRLGDQTQLVKLEGAPGPHKTEQTSSHPHHVAFDPSGRFVLVPDKGLDRVFVFAFDEAAGRLTPTAQGSVQARAGSAPRHLGFHPKLPVVWVFNEIASSVTTYAFDTATGALTPRRILPSIPPEFTGENSCAEIAVSADGRFVYGSNRGHDSVAAFTVDAAGQLTAAGWTPTGGRVPRYIGIDPTGHFLYAANEQGHTVTSFRIDARTGKLTSAGAPISIPSPVTIAFRVSPA